MQFETAQEMEAWRQRMISPTPYDRKRRRRRKPRVSTSMGLGDRVKNREKK